MSIATKVAHNYIIQVIAKFIATALGLITMALITRHLGIEEFGRYTIIITILSFFGILADLGLTLVTVQMISQKNTDLENTLSNLLGLRFVSAILFLGLAPLCIYFSSFGLDIKNGVLITSGSFFFTALIQILIGLFQKELAMNKVAISEVISRLILLVGTVISVWCNWHILSILIFTVLSSLVQFAVLYLYSRKYIFIKLRFDFALWKKILIKSWPLAITIALNLIYLKADTLILSLIKSEEIVGLYGAAYKVVDVLITLPFMFAGIVLPILTFEWSNKKTDNYKIVLQKSFDTMLIIAIPLAVGAQFVSNRVMSLVAGEAFYNSGSILKILIIACAIVFVQVIFSHAVIAIEKQKKLIAGYLFTAVTALAGYLYFIPKYSYFGAAWVTVYSEVAITLVSFYLIWKYVKFIPNFQTLIKALTASGFMAIFLTQHDRMNLISSLFGATVIYFTILFLLKGLHFIPIKEILRIKK